MKVRQAPSKKGENREEKREMLIILMILTMNINGRARPGRMANGMGEWGLARGTRKGNREGRAHLAHLQRPISQGGHPELNHRFFLARYIRGTLLKTDTRGRLRAGGCG